LSNAKQYGFDYNLHGPEEANLTAVPLSGAHSAFAQGGQTAGLGSGFFTSYKGSKLPQRGPRGASAKNKF